MKNLLCLLGFSFIIFIIISIVIVYLQKKEKDEDDIPFRKLKQIEFRLKEYIKFSPKQRLEKFDVLQKALYRLYNLICQYCPNYEKRDILYIDQLHSDIDLIPYQNEEEIDYFSPKSVLESYNLLSEEKQQIVDHYLMKNSKKWLEEIPVIESLLKNIV